MLKAENLAINPPSKKRHYLINLLRNVGLTSLKVLREYAQYFDESKFLYSARIENVNVFSDFSRVRLKTLFQIFWPGNIEI